MAATNNTAYPFPGYNFCLYIDALKIGFRSVSGLTLKKDAYTAFHEGGTNFGLSILREEKKEPCRMTLSKGVGSYNPAKSMSKITVLILMVMDEYHKPVHAYYFSNAYVEQVTVSDLDAESSQTMIDSITIIYDSATEIDLSGRTGISAYREQLSAAAAENSGTSEANIERIRQHNEEIRRKRSEAASEAEAAPIER